MSQPKKPKKFHRNKKFNEKSSHKGAKDRHPEEKFFSRPKFEKGADPKSIRFDDIFLESKTEQEMSFLVLQSQQKLRKMMGESLGSGANQNLKHAPLSDPNTRDEKPKLESVPASPFAPSRSYKELSKWQVKETSKIATSDDAEKSEKAEPSLAQMLSAELKEKTPQERGQKRALDPWQQEAFDALKSGKHVVVDAPTSAGKTRVIEALIDDRFASGEPLRLVYTTPVKSLSNDKYREFCERYGSAKIGINTGDFKENLSAPIVIATLETYRNSLLGVEPNMSRMTVVYDEYHYLQDESRGSAWEESMILTPRESQLVLLSASVPNPEDFAQWITKLSRKECAIVRVTHRPVPLEHVVYTRWGWALAEDLPLDADKLWQAKKMLRGWNNALKRQRRTGTVTEFFAPVEHALQLNLGPVVVYAGRRGDAESFAHGMGRYLRQEFLGPQAEKMRERLRGLPGWEFVPSDLQRIIRKFGVAYHHSGMIPPGRVAIETLLKEGLLRVCAGTMGISLGVNFAVRSALISDESRPGENGETTYSNSEILQMLGRAGRRGHDKQGFCLWVNVGRFALQRPGDREPLRSSLKFDPTTVLGILGQHENLAYLSEFYRKSFFMRDKSADLVLLRDNDLITAKLYTEGFDELACSDVVATYNQFRKHKEKTGLPCYKCPAMQACHSMQEKAMRSPLQRIVSHLTKVGAVESSVPTKMGQLARHFPQAGGLILADLLAKRRLGAHNFADLIQVMAAFGSAHYKKIPETYTDDALFEELDLAKQIQKYYPEDIFPELYDDADRFEGDDVKIFREFNRGAASIVTQWLDPKTEWQDLVAEHSTRFFSAGDCMMVLFRFSTFLQSCARLDEFDPELSDLAREKLRILLRDPLDARNRMLMDEEEEKDEVREEHSKDKEDKEDKEDKGTPTAAPP